MTITKLSILLKPTANQFENESVLNPAIVQVDDSIHVFYRATSLGNNSTIGYAKLNGPMEVAERWDHPIISPTEDYEIKGVEDPRITYLENQYLMTYVAFDGNNARTAWATSKDLVNWNKKGLITPNINYEEIINYQTGEEVRSDLKMFMDETRIEFHNNQYLWHKDVLFWPERINGKIGLVSRVRPNIQLLYFDSLDSINDKNIWENHFRNIKNETLLENGLFDHETKHIGAGGPPLKTDKGWLFIYHGVKGEMSKGNKEQTYYACAALLDLNDPFKVIGRTQKPLFGPDEDWEKTGVVNNVVFPSGQALFGDDLYIYYGAADKYVAVAKVSLSELLEELI